jgi:hypothetical protein
MVAGPQARSPTRAAAQKSNQIVDRRPRRGLASKTIAEEATREVRSFGDPYGRAAKRQPASAHGCSYSVPPTAAECERQRSNFSTARPQQALPSRSISMIDQTSCRGAGRNQFNRRKCDAKLRGVFGRIRKSLGRASAGQSPAVDTANSRPSGPLPAFFRFRAAVAKPARRSERNALYTDVALRPAQSDMPRAAATVTSL